MSQQTVTDHMLEVLRRLVQQERNAEIRFKITREASGDLKLNQLVIPPNTLKPGDKMRLKGSYSAVSTTRIQTRVFIDGQERGHHGASVPDPAIPEGVQDELQKFMHTLVHNLGELGID